MRLLLIDDDPDLRGLIEDTAPAWVEVLSVGSSREALDVLAEQTETWPHLALVDLRLPAYLCDVIELEGLALAKWLNRGAGRDVPVVLISAHPFPAEARGGTGPGVLGLVGKPLDLGPLYRFLAAWVALFGLDSGTERGSANGPLDRGAA